MAQIIGSQIKLNNGQMVTPQQGGWYDGRQYWGGTLSDPGVINSQSNQQGAGQAVSKEVNQQTSIAAGKAPDANQQYIDQQKAALAKTPTATPLVTTSIPKSSTPASVSSAGLGVVTPPTTLNLPDLYKNLSTQAGLTDIEKRITEKTNRYNEVQAGINDNPWLSESNRVGRISKLTSDFENGIKTDQNELAMKKQDIQTQLDLATKQFDINSQAAQQAMQQFNALLSMGALDGASGNDIAGITAATGISSDMIQAAINAQKAKNTKTQVITSTNDAGIVTVSVINPDTGEIISQKSLGAVGNAENGSSGSSGSKVNQSAEANAAIINYIQDKNAQNAASPEDFITLLIRQYPAAGLSLDDANKIRKQLGND